MPLVFAVVYALVAGAPADAAPADPLRRVRSMDWTASLLLKHGTERSARFRDLVATLERSGTIVYVEVREESSRPVGGRLVFVGEAAGIRWVKAVVDSGTSNHLRTCQDVVRLTAILGHELQHAVEASRAPSLQDVREFERYFRAIGVAEGPAVLDTLAARAVGKEVAEELRGRGQRRPTLGQLRASVAAP
jgi:hypothetical protein